MNKKAIILIIAAVMLISTFSIALVNSGKSPGGNAAPVETATSSAYTGSVTIYPNGTVSVPGVLSRSGSTYSLLQNLTGTLTDLMNGSAVTGAGYTVTNPGATAVLFRDVSNITVYNLAVDNALFAVELYSVTNGSVTGLAEQSVTSGIYITYATHISLAKSIVNSAASFGITCSYVSGLDIENVTLTNQSGTAINLYQVSGAFLFGDICTPSASFPYPSGIDVQYSSDVVLSENSFSGFYYGLSVISSVNVHSNDEVSNSDGSLGMNLLTVTGFYSAHDSVTNTGSNPVNAFNVVNASWQYDDFNHSGYGCLIDVGHNLIFAHDDFSNVTGSTAATSYGGLQLNGIYNVNVSYDMFNMSGDTLSYGLYIYSASANISVSYDWVYAPNNQSDYAVYLHDVAGVYMNFTYLDSDYTVYFYGSSSGTFFNHDTFVLSASNGYAFYCYGDSSSYLSVTNSSFYSATGLTNVQGIASGSNLLEHVYIGNNAFYDISLPVVLQPYYGADVTILNNSMSGSVFNGITCTSLSQVTVYSNHIYNVSSVGMFLERINTLSVSRNTVTLNSTSDAVGIFVRVCSDGVTVVNNTVTNPAPLFSSFLPSGILVAYETGQTSVAGNTITGSYYGLVLNHNEQTTVADNSVTTAYFGIYSLFDNGYRYYGNQVSNASSSLHLIYDNNGSVYANTLQNASSYMLYIFETTATAFYHNNFLNGSSIPTYIYMSSGLTWNLSSPVGGNYWSNYTGSGPNGFGTTPYTVNGTSIDYLPLTSRWTSPTVTFIEAGLPAGLSWSVSLGASVILSTSATIVFQPDNVLPVNESYSIGSVPGYTASVTTGTLHLTGTSQVVMIAFTPYTYAVTFTETGLQSGTAWSVTLNGITRTSTTSTVTFNEPNGSYAYTVSRVAGYIGGNTSGTATVAGGPVAESAVFAEYTLTVVETGLPSGSSWSVKVNGNTYTSTAATMTIPIPPGTYSITVTGPSGFRAVLPGSTVTVANISSAFAVQFTRPGAGTAALGEGIAIGVVVGAIAGILAVMFVVPAIRSRKKS